MELCAGVPANWIVLVVGVIVDWAFAAKVANAMKTTKLDKTAAQFLRKTGLLRANDARIPEGLTFWPSCPGTLAPGIFSGVQEGIIQTAGASDLQHDLHPEALLTTRFKQESDQPIPQIYGPAIYKPIFLTQKKQANEVTR